MIITYNENYNQKSLVDSLSSHAVENLCLGVTFHQME